MDRQFRYGLELEFVVARKTDLRPLWHKDLDFKQLYAIMESISLDGIPSLAGLDPEDAHAKILPYVVEGYHIKDENNKSVDMMPKGVEIRSPVCSSLNQAMEISELLYHRLRQAMQNNDYDLLAISHHPFESKFWGPQANRRPDFWKWAMEVMTTCGPDINISFPAEVGQRLFDHQEDFEAKINYYAPALTALSVASPFLNGELKAHADGHYQSIRTFRRSTVAPAIEWHANEGHRIEYKFFDMSASWEDFRAYFLLCLGITLDETLQGRSWNQERIYDLGEVSRLGLRASFVEARLTEVFTKIPETLKRWDINPEGLSPVIQRFTQKKTQADDMIKNWLDKRDMQSILAGRILP